MGKFENMAQQYNRCIATIYGKTFEEENFHCFHDFALNLESFPTTNLKPRSAMHMCPQVCYCENFP